MLFLILILILMLFEQVMVQLKEGMEGNALKVTVMDRLVAELAGIETALVSLQDQVNFVFLNDSIFITIVIAASRNQ